MIVNGGAVSLTLEAAVEGGTYTLVALQMLLYYYSQRVRITPFTRRARQRG
jgi:hypothetical protein